MKICESTFSKRIFLFVALIGLAASGVATALDYPDLAAESKKEKAEQIANPVLAPKLLDKAINDSLYIVGPGDVIVVQVYGVTSEPLLLEVLPEGVVSIPQVGVVKLGQITLAEAKKRIAEAMMTRVRDRAIDVNLAQVRSFKVSVTGGVEKPGVVVVSATDRVSEACMLAGGLQKKASRRNIQLIKETDTTLADLDYFNATGDVRSNPYLNEGHVVFVPVVSDSFNKVEIYGAVNSPGVFEYRPGDRVSELIALGFGLSADADIEGAELVRFDPVGAGKSSIKLDLRAASADPSSAANLALQPDDRIFIRALAGFRTKEQVIIAGEVKYPGVYPIQPGCETLLELVQRAGGTLEKASLSEAEMYRSQRFFREDRTSFEQLLQLSTDKLSDFELQYFKEMSAGRTGKVAVNFDGLLGHGREELDIRLIGGDYIRIPQKSFAVTVMGRVVNPGLVPYKDSQPVDYYIKAAGGYGYKADKGDIRIIKANTGALVKSGQGAEVAMGDRIMVPQKKAVDVWGFVKDVGWFLANIATIYIVVDQAVN
ncbi:MAG: SLBB domain-containing protein [Candidatus Zixiibacteriota bacterium]